MIKQKRFFNNKENSFFYQELCEYDPYEEACKWINNNSIKVTFITATNLSRSRKNTEVCVFFEARA